MATVMLTDNKDKKALVDKLLRDNHITIDDAYLLLDEQEDSANLRAPYIPYPVYPNYPNGWWGIYPPTAPQWPYDRWIITCNTGTLTNVLSGLCVTTDVSAMAFPGTGVSYTSTLN